MLTQSALREQFTSQQSSVIQTTKPSSYKRYFTGRGHDSDS